MTERGEPPKGFRISAGDDGALIVRYRTTGMGCAAVFFAVWLTLWTIGTVTMTTAAFFDPGGLRWSMVLVMIPFWCAEIGVLLYVVWLFGSNSVFTLTASELTAERAFWRIRRRHVFPRGSIVEIRQIKDGGEGEDSFPSWTLAVVGEKEVRILSRQPLDKSAWLGPVLAEWAGVKYRPDQTPQRHKTL